MMSNVIHAKEAEFNELIQKEELVLVEKEIQQAMKVIQKLEKEKEKKLKLLPKRS